MYGIIYDWFLTLFVGTGVTDLEGMSFSIGGSSVDMVSWLCHSATFIVLAVLVFVAFRFVWWLVKFVGSAFLLRR